MRGLFVFACKIRLKNDIPVCVIVFPYHRIGITLVEAIRARRIGKEAVGHDQSRRVVLDRQRMAKSHQFIVVEATVGDDVVFALDEISDLGGVRKASVDHVDTQL